MAKIPFLSYKAQCVSLTDLSCDEFQPRKANTTPLDPTSCHVGIVSFLRLSTIKGQIKYHGVSVAKVAILSICQQCHGYNYIKFIPWHTFPPVQQWVGVELKTHGYTPLEPQNQQSPQPSA